MKINKKIILSLAFFALFSVGTDLALANNNTDFIKQDNKEDGDLKKCEPMTFETLRDNEISYLKSLINQKDVSLQKKETEEKRALQDTRMTTVFSKIEKYIDDKDLDKTKNYQNSIVKNTKELRIKSDEAASILNVNKKELEKIVERQNESLEDLSKDSFKNCDEQEPLLEEIRIIEKNDLKDLVKSKKDIYTKEIQILQKKFLLSSSEILSRMKADLIK